MKASYLAGKKLADFIEVTSPAWSLAEAVDFRLSPAPMGLQPTQAIRAQWKDRQYGLIDHVRISAVHNGEHLGVRMQWDCPEESLNITDNDVFTDAAAIMLPCVPGAPLLLMGNEKAPVNACYWRANVGQKGINIIARGIGTSQSVAQGSVVCRQLRRDGKWLLVITRPLLVEGLHPQAQLRPGDKTPFGVAIWAGANQERAGIKSVGISSEDLFLERIE